MASREKRVVEIDEASLERAREAMYHPVGELSDADVVELALRAYVGRRALAASQSITELDEDEGLRAAVDETHAMRRARSGPT